jgi:hypothetical protein
VPRRLRIALAALVGLFVLAACTAPTPTPPPTPTATPPAENAASILEASVAALKEQESFHFAMDMTFTLGQGSLTFNAPITFEGDVLTEGKSQGVLSIAALGLNLQSEIITTEAGVWSTNPATGLWELTPDSGPPFDPNEVLSPEIEDFVVLAFVGSDEIDGQPMYHLSGVMEAGALADEPSNLRANYWVGINDNLPRRVSIQGEVAIGEDNEILEMAQGAAASIELQLDLTDYGKPVVIEAPVVGTRSTRTELVAVSHAVRAMMVANNLTAIPNQASTVSADCTTGTQDMTLFPDSASVAGSADKLQDPTGTTYVDGVDPLGDKNGYLLFGHDITGGDNQAALVNYINFDTTLFCYTVNTAGEISQYDENGVELN